MTIDDFIKNLEECLPGLEPGTLNAETKFRELPVWDSLAVLVTLSMIDADCGVSLSAEELNKCSTVADLFEKIEQKKSSS